MLTIEQRAELDAVMRKRRGNALGAPCAVRCAVERRAAIAGNKPRGI